MPACATAPPQAERGKALARNAPALVDVLRGVLAVTLCLVAGKLLA